MFPLSPSAAEVYGFCHLSRVKEPESTEASKRAVMFQYSHGGQIHVRNVCSLLVVMRMQMLRQSANSVAVLAHMWPSFGSIHPGHVLVAGRPSAPSDSSTPACLISCLPTPIVVSVCLHPSLPLWVLCLFSLLDVLCRAGTFSLSMTIQQLLLAKQKDTYPPQR